MPDLHQFRIVFILFCFCDTGVAHGNRCDHILACGGSIRSPHGLVAAHIDVARLDVSIGVFLVRMISYVTNKTYDNGNLYTEPAPDGP